MQRHLPVRGKIFLKMLYVFLTTSTKETWEMAHPVHPNPLMDGEVMSILCINSDWMHCAHLGTYQEYLGSILYILFYDLLPDDAATNCRIINSQLKAYWRVHPEQGHFQNITLSMVRSSTGYPTLKGRAAEVKKTVRALRAVWDLHRARDPASDEFLLHAQIDLL